MEKYHFFKLNFNAEEAEDTEDAEGFNKKLWLSIKTLNALA